MREFIAAIWVVWGLYLTYRFFLPRDDHPEDGSPYSWASIVFSFITAFYIIT